MSKCVTQRFLSLVENVSSHVTELVIEIRAWMPFVFGVHSIGLMD
jgi:hypothetical protein